MVTVNYVSQFKQEYVEGTISLEMLEKKLERELLRQERIGTVDSKEIEQFLREQYNNGDMSHEEIVESLHEYAENGNLPIEFRRQLEGQSTWR